MTSVPAKVVRLHALHTNELIKGVSGTYSYSQQPVSFITSSVQKRVIEARGNCVKASGQYWLEQGACLERENYLNEVLTNLIEEHIPSGTTYVRYRVWVEGWR